MREELRAQVYPKTNPQNIVMGNHYRISILTEGLFRLEYNQNGKFEDHATQTVWNRNFPETPYQLLDRPDGLEIITAKAHLIYDKKEFSANGLSIEAVGDYSAYDSIWHYGERFESLGGTARTLDLADGSIPLEHGIIGRNGFSVLDDSKSLILLEDGWISLREDEEVDIYFWAYGHDYLGALRDFCYLCGKSPMVPRYALGNWWSRFYKYTQESYKTLMERFAAENIPFSVAVLDMDWHLTEIDKKYGSGWTGYTWNKDMFPDPEAFLLWLHEHHMRVTLNIHPAGGIQAHEEVYPQIAETMGVNTEIEQPVVFDAADPKYLEACFQHIFHPLEDDGVDFWWLDWQSGGLCKVEGLDPLWVLNHYHYLDSGRDKKRPMTFSRYAGPGSHRYPIGFSGDTLITWNSLDFQPYFTAAASNIGYGMWSHDIGGHMLGERDDEMAGRWLQFGVFSPVMRLHSSNSEFTGKEPWNYKPEVEHMMKRFLRLRHELIPYLYTMNHRAYEEDIPLILPMYYHYPECSQAYEVPNQYEFGSQLMTAPITSPQIPKLNMAKVNVWLPEDLYFDFFTGQKYQGGRMMAMYRDINSIPVLAKAGAIIPLTNEIENVEANPSSFCIHVFAGADGNFTLYEDDGVSVAYETGICATTNMHFSWGEHAEFVIEAAEGSLELIPGIRDYTIQFHGILPCSSKILVNNENKEASQTYNEKLHVLTCGVRDVSVTDRLSIHLSGLRLAENNIIDQVFKCLNQAEISFPLKDALYQLIKTTHNTAILLSQLQSMELDRDLQGALVEIITA